MEQYIYVNYAYEDQKMVLPLIERFEAEGLSVFSGNGSEERVAGSSFVLNVLTPASHASKTFRKITNFTIKNAKDYLSVHVSEEGISSEVEEMLDMMLVLFKMKYTAGSAPVKEQQEETVQELPVKEETAEPVPEKDPLIEVIEMTPEGRIKTDDKAETVSAPEPAAEKEEPVRNPDKQEIYQLGMTYLNGEGVDPDEKKAYFYFRQAANQGYPEAQYQMSVCYDKGIGVKRDITEAARWCEMAAFGGHLQAQMEIGYCYEYGQGVVRNMKEAVRWYEIASEQGSTEATNNLAFCYQKGRGVPKNVPKALELYKKAADAGHASAQYNLGFCYWYGEGVAINKEKAVELFRASSGNGNAKAGQMLKILHQRSYIKQ